MRLLKGNQAPAFLAQDIEGKTVTLSDYKDKKLLICFFRYAGCPFCQLAVRNLVFAYPELHKRGLNIITLFQSPKPSVLKYPGEFKPPFPLIPDPNEDIYNLYGIEDSLQGTIKGILDVQTIYKVIFKERIRQGKIDGDFLLMPGYFFIDAPNHTIQKAIYSDQFFYSSLFEQIEAFLSAPL